MYRIRLIDRFTEWQHMRSFRSGNFRAEFEHDILTGNRNGLERLLRETLPPDWHVSLALLRASHELLELTIAVTLARDVGDMSLITARLARELRPAVRALASTADRVTCVAVQNAHSSELQQALDNEARRLGEFTDSVRKTRETLAQALLENDGNPALTASQAAIGAFSHLDPADLT